MKKRRDMTLFLIRYEFGGVRRSDWKLSLTCVWEFLCIYPTNCGTCYFSSPGRNSSKTSHFSLQSFLPTVSVSMSFFSCSSFVSELKLTFFLHLCVCLEDRAVKCHALQDLYIHTHSFTLTCINVDRLEPLYIQKSWYLAILLSPADMFLAICP